MLDPRLQLRGLFLLGSFCSGVFFEVSITAAPITVPAPMPRRMTAVELTELKKSQVTIPISR